MNRGVFISSLVLGHALVLTTASAIAIYGFDYYEKFYGKGISFQISLWFVVIGALVTAFGFGIGVAVSNWISKFWIGLVLGGLFAVFIFGLSILGNQLTNDTGLRKLLLFSSWLIGSFLLPLVMSKLKD